MKEKQKTAIFGFIMFVTLLLFSLDFWGWGQPTSVDSLVLGLPIWIYYLLFLTLATFVFFYLVAKYVWRDEK